MAELKTYSGQMSYHQMLTRVQEFDPVLLYRICKLILEEDPDRDNLRDWFESKKFFRKDVYGSLTDNHGGQLERVIDEVFRNSTMHLGVWSTSCGDDDLSNNLCVRHEFVRWLKSIELVLDDDLHLVTIPA